MVPNRPGIFISTRGSPLTFYLDDCCRWWYETIEVRVVRGEEQADMSERGDEVVPLAKAAILIYDCEYLDELPPARLHTMDARSPQSLVVR